jgi:Tfp pilus assembly protein PilX
MSFKEIKLQKRKNERGVALMVALFALLLLGAIAMAMTFMADTETAINFNYRDSQVAYFGAQAGLEEARDRLRINGPVVDWNADGTSDAITPMTQLPTLTNGAVFYITNPDEIDGANGVQPWNVNNAYFDEELCHEQFSGLAMSTPPAANVPCPKTSAGIPAGTAWYTEFASASPQRGTAAALPYKWVRITLKQNRSSAPYSVNEPGAAVPSTDPDHRVCWHGAAQRQYLLANGKAIELPENYQDRMAGIRQMMDVLRGSPFQPAIAFAPKGKTTTTTTTTTTGTTTTGTTTTGTTTGTTTTTTTGTTTGTTTTTTSGYVYGASGVALLPGNTTPGETDYCQLQSQSLYSVYVITTLSVTRNGSRRMTQYEISRAQISMNLPSALTFNGPKATIFNTPSSNAFTVEGDDGCGGPDKPALGGPDEPGCVKTEYTTQAQCDAEWNPDRTAPCNDPHDPDGVYVATSSETFAQKDNHCTSDYLRDVADLRRPDQYGGACPDPDVACSGDVLTDLSNPANPMRTVSDLQNLVQVIRDQADEVVSSGTAVSDWGTQMTCTDPNDWSTCTGGSPRIIVVEGNATIPSGHGILVVTGEAELTGGTDWQGAILVIGQGRLLKSGGGSGNTQGAVMVANIQCATNVPAADGGCSGTLDTSASGTNGLPGAPYFQFDGGGTSLIQFNACALNNGSRRPYYGILAYREMTY